MVYPAYVNNSEIVKLEAFERPDVVRFVESMKHPGRIYSLRWGKCTPTVPFLLVHNL